MKKQDVLNRVLNSESSIFAKDDVVRLIEMIDESGSRKITVSDIGTALESALNELNRNSDDVIDRGSVEFDIQSGNEIYISDISFDFDFIRDTLEEYLMPLGEPDSEE
jgi:replication initiation and membrane attachment protein DnaB